MPQRHTGDKVRNMHEHEETGDHMDKGDMEMSSMDHSAMDHSEMGHDHDMAGMGHSAMDHSTMDHSAMDHSAAGHAHGHDMAGMDHMHMGHDMSGMGGMGDMAKQFRDLFWVMLALSVPTVLLSPMFGHLIGYHLPDAGWVRWVSPVLGTIMYVVGGKPFLTGAVGEIRARKPGMMLLVALAITTAFLASWGSTLGVLPGDLDFWWELALLVVIMLLGHWIEMKSMAASSSALDSLAALLPDQAELLEDGATREVPTSELSKGDVVLVRPGGRVPADGTVVDGRADVDESMLTGESRPVLRGPGDAVVAGTVSTDSQLTVRVDATGDDTALAGIQHLVAQAQSSTTKTQRLADRAAGWLFWFALAAALLTVVVWSLISGPQTGITRAITVLVIACPHALGLAIPMVVSIATGQAARNGVLITQREALEQMRRVDTVVFDKTGTLTKGEPGLVGVLPLIDEGVGATAGNRVLALAAAVESQSEHPIARAIVAGAAERGVAVPPVSDASSEPAVGVTGTVDGESVAVGGPSLADGAALPAPVEAQVSEWQSQGATTVYVTVGGEVAGVVAVRDEIRPESVEAIADLHSAGVRSEMLTGDAPDVAQAVAAELGIDDVHAGMKPDGRAEAIQELRGKGRITAFVGDGVNDAPALASADVGIAIGAGTDVAIASAGVVLAGDDPRMVRGLIDLSAKAYRLMKQNLWWAAGYNLIAVPLAAGVLAHWGIVMPMSIGALLMAASTVVVALNAQRLRAWTPKSVGVGADLPQEHGESVVR